MTNGSKKVARVAVFVLAVILGIQALQYVRSLFPTSGLFKIDIPWYLYASGFVTIVAAISCLGFWLIGKDDLLEDYYPEEKRIIKNNALKYRNADRWGWGCFVCGILFWVFTCLLVGDFDLGELFGMCIWWFPLALCVTAVDLLKNDDALLKAKKEYDDSFEGQRGNAQNNASNDKFESVNENNDNVAIPVDELVDACLNGEVNDIDPVKVAGILRSLADQGIAAYQAKLGRFYLHGIGVVQNYTEAVNLFKLSSSQGDSDGQLSLSLCYFAGIGVEKNRDEGIRLLRLSAAQGNSVAIENLRKLGF